VILIQIARLVFGHRYQTYVYNSIDTRADALLIGCSVALWLFNRFAMLIPACLFGAALSNDPRKVTAFGLTLAAYAPPSCLFRRLHWCPAF